MSNFLDLPSYMNKVYSIGYYISITLPLLLIPSWALATADCQVSGDLWAQVNQEYRQGDPSLKDIAYLLTKVAREAVPKKGSMTTQPKKGSIARAK